MAEEFKKIHHRQVLTDEIISSIQKGTAPWQKPWPKGLKKERPVSCVTGKEYRGGNFLCLSTAPFADPRWMTFKQAAKKKWNVKKGEKGHYIEYISWFETKKEKDPDTGEIVIKESKRDNPIIRRTVVFNGEQIEGIPDYFQDAARLLPEKEVVEAAQRAIEKSGAKIVFDSPGEAYYNRNTDVIHMTPKETFKSTYDMYSSILHQLAHWTAHPSRLNRKECSVSDKPVDYAREELRAELASYFMAFELGVGLTQEHIDNHASFSKQWLELLGGNRNEIYRIAKDAESITSYIYEFSKEAEAEKEVKQVSSSPARDAALLIENNIAEEAEREETVKTAVMEEIFAETAAVEKERVKKEDIQKENIIEAQEEKFTEEQTMEEEAVPVGASAEDIAEYTESFIDF
ncbi:MAG: DUF1738 domain-containing protein [Clostridia bacterium]|nr:DUF1738 domain-containing protein [Clostridia bacterium]